MVAVIALPYSAMDTVNDTVDSFSDFFSSKIQKIRAELDTLATRVSPASTDVSCPSHGHSLGIFQKASFDVEILKSFQNELTVFPAGS